MEAEEQNDKYSDSCCGISCVGISSLLGRDIYPNVPTNQNCIASRSSPSPYSLVASNFWTTVWTYFEVGPTKIEGGSGID